MTPISAQTKLTVVLAGEHWRQKNKGDQINFFSKRFSMLMRLNSHGYLISDHFLSLNKDEFDDL